MITPPPTAEQIALVRRMIGYCRQHDDSLNVTAEEWDADGDALVSVLAQLDAQQAEIARLGQERDDAVDYARRAAAGAIDRARMPLTERVWLEAVSERDALKAEIARLREALEAIVNTGDDCPACDRGVLRRQEKGHWPECPFGKATDALTGRTPLEDSADGA